MKGSKNIVILFGATSCQAGRKISGQKRAVKSNLSGYVLDNYLPMRSDSKHSTKYIHELTIILISPDGSNELY